MMPCYIYIHFDPNTQTTRTSANDMKTTDNPTKRAQGEEVEENTLHSVSLPNMVRYLR